MNQQINLPIELLYSVYPSRNYRLVSKWTNIYYLTSPDVYFSVLNPEWIDWLQYAYCYIRVWRYIDVLSTVEMYNVVKLNIDEEIILTTNLKQLLIHIKELDLCLRNDNVEIISDMRNIHALDLSSYLLNDIRPLSNLINMRILCISWTNVADISPIANLLLLEELIMDEMQYTINIISLSKLTKLQHLALYDTNISSQHILSKLRSLQSLDIRHCNIEDVSPLINLTNLRTLYVHGPLLYYALTQLDLPNLKIHT